MYPLSNTAREKSALESGTYRISVSSPLSLLHTGFAGVYLHGPAEKRGSADQRERTALGSPVDKLPPAGQLGAPLVFSNISTTRGTSFTRRLFHNLVSISIVNW